jgi:hypothetical protein
MTQEPATMHIFKNTMWSATNAAIIIAYLLVRLSRGSCQSSTVTFFTPVSRFGSARLSNHRLWTFARQTPVLDHIHDDSDDEDSTNDKEDTVRVRIWRALASGEEMSLKQLGATVGQHKDLLSHLVHVEKQAKTLNNKNTSWRKRRGLLNDDNDDDSTSSVQKEKINKLRFHRRVDKKRQIFVRLG